LRKIESDEQAQAQQKQISSQKSGFLQKFINQIKAKKVLILFSIIVILIALVLYLYVSSNRSKTIIVEEEEVIEEYDNNSQSISQPQPKLPPTTVVSNPQAAPKSLESVKEPPKPEPQPLIADNIQAVDINNNNTVVATGKQTLNVTVLSDEVWISLEIDGKKLYPDGATLRKGQSLTWEANNSFRIVIGYAPGVRVLFNGVEVNAVQNSKQDVSVLNLKKP
ncbi:MAG: DUF4115 domain-containing protein, partial [Elusimicrobiota bacterium]|jgi:hypothetical protein|nr:DUF4115 domain-containing protein [Elusimicrobiota bacterium]